MFRTALLVSIEYISAYGKGEEQRKCESFIRKVVIETSDHVRLSATQYLTVFGIDDTVLIDIVPHNITAFENITGYWLAQNKPEIGLRAAHELAIGAGNQGMVVGQAQDLLAEGKHIDEANMKYIHAHKTGALITASVRIGAIIGGANEEQLAALSRYGQHIGLAFQITDDILDVVGDEAVIGKPVGSDEKNEKATYPALYGLDASRAMAQEQCRLAQECLTGLPGDCDVLHYIADYIVNRQK